MRKEMLDDNITHRRSAGHVLDQNDKITESQNDRINEMIILHGGGNQSASR